MAQKEYWPRFGLENYSYIFPFERDFDSVKSTAWMQRHWLSSVYSSILYVCCIYYGQKLMESRKAFNLEKPLLIWNAALALFSLFGLIRMTPEMWWSVFSNSFEYSICTASFAQGVTGFWTEMFALSKLLEFGDTIFIILRKRQLLFLHWYHHVTVLIYTWHAYKDHTASGRWFIWMNYAVHTIMYAYYALRSKRIRLPKWSAMIITFLQIMQMVGGVIIGVSIFQIKVAGRACQQTWNNLYFSFMIYFSYFLLFMNFFYHAYLKAGNRYSQQNANKLKADAIMKETDEAKAQNADVVLKNGVTRRMARVN